MTTPKYDGVKITLGGQEFILPDLNLGRSKKVTPILMRIGNSAGEINEANYEAVIDSLVEALVLGLSRNYPDITADALLDLVIPLDEAKAAMAALQEKTGLLTAEASASSGEA